MEFIGELDTDEPECPLAPPGALIMSGFAGQPPLEAALTPPRPVPFFFPLSEFPHTPLELSDATDDDDEEEDTEEAPEVR